jgi:hypothetical protein
MKRVVIAATLALLTTTAMADDSPIKVRIAETPADITPWLKNQWFVIQSVSNDQIVVTHYSVNRGQCEVSKPWGGNHPIAYGQYIKAPIQDRCYPLEATVSTNVGNYTFKWDAGNTQAGLRAFLTREFGSGAELIQYLVVQSVADVPIHVKELKINRGHCGVTVPNGTITSFGGYVRVSTSCSVLEASANVAGQDVTFTFDGQEGPR